MNSITYNQEHIQREKSLEGLANQRIYPQKELIKKKFNHQIYQLEADVERAETHARSARWIAIATVTVTIALVILLILV